VGHNQDFSATRLEAGEKGKGDELDKQQESKLPLSVNTASAQTIPTIGSEKKKEKKEQKGGKKAAGKARKNASVRKDRKFVEKKQREVNRWKLPKKLRLKKPQII